LCATSAVSLQIFVKMDGIVNDSLLARHIGGNLCKPPVVFVAGGKKALWSTSVSISSKWGDEGCQVPIGLSERDGVEPITSIRYRLPSIPRDTSSRVERHATRECFPMAMFIKRRHVDCTTRCSVVLPRHHHAVAPCHQFSVWHFLNHSKRHIPLKVLIDLLLPM
jgi:hypothetical protein